MEENINNKEDENAFNEKCDESLNHNNLTIQSQFKDFLLKFSKKVKFSFSLSTVIATLAFVISAIVGVYAYKISVENRHQDLKSEFREILNQITTSSVEEFETASKRKIITEDEDVDLFYVDKIKDYINRKNILLAEQALNIINELPEGKITSSEFVLLASHMIDLELYKDAEELIKIGLRKANNSMTKSGAHQVYAKYYVNVSNCIQGDEEFRNAIKAINEDEMLDRFSKRSHAIETIFNWADSEMAYCNRHEKLLNLLAEINDSLIVFPKSPAKKHFEKKVDLLQNTLKEYNILSNF